MDEEEQRTEDFIRLLTAHQDRLFRYIYALVPCEADARDILQETSMAVYRKFSGYDSARPFFPWACRFAYYEVCKHRERSARLPRPLSEDVVELLAAERERIDAQLEERLAHIEGCLGELPARDRELVAARYAGREPVEAMMERFGMSRRTLFRNLALLREKLHDCVRRRLGEMPATQTK